MNPGTAIPLLGRQYRALRASWATWALAAIALLFAATSPVTARYLPEILGGLVGGGSGGTPLPIDVSALPDPTPADAWAQWSSNLSQPACPYTRVLSTSLSSLSFLPWKWGIMGLPQGMEPH